jgi:ABC-2 type transport system permease protein
MTRQGPVQALFWKEIRQLTRSRGALLTSLFFPFALLVVVPSAQLMSRSGTRPDLPVAPVPGLIGLHTLPEFLLFLSFPLFYVLAGLMTPSLAATYTVVGERERRSLELLMTLPVSVREILTAKLAANLVTACVALLPLFVVNAALVLLVGGAGPLYVLAALFLLVSALASSVGVSLLLALLARDLRTSNNLSGLAIPPVMLVTAICVVLVPGLGRFVVLSMLLLLLTAGTVVACLRWLTFERYLS